MQLGGISIGSKEIDVADEAVDKNIYDKVEEALDIEACRNRPTPSLSPLSHQVSPRQQAPPRLCTRTIAALE